MDWIQGLVSLEQDDDPSQAACELLLPWDESSGVAVARLPALQDYPVIAGPHAPLQPGPPTGLLARALAGESLDADEYADAIQQAVEEERSAVARQLAAKTALTSRRLEQWKAVLAVPRAWVSRSAHAVDRQLDWNWLQANRMLHRGRVVAIGEGRLVASASSAASLKHALRELRQRERCPAPLLIVRLDAEGRVC